MNPSDTPAVLAFVESLCGSMGSASAHRAARLLDHIEADLSRISPEGLAGPNSEDLEWTAAALRGVDARRVRFWAESIEKLSQDGVAVVTSGSLEYPMNLRLVPNRPPVLFIRGQLLQSDERAIAVVGTRSASEEGRTKAAIVAGRLAKAGVTVVSGLAEGIDTAAHRAALDAGGRTITVFGTGIDHVFPNSNRGLARDIAGSGACLSQWWPGQGGTRWTFPLRNIVTSGLSLGTVVVEASETSGAKLQAEDARRHGRRLLLLKHVVASQPWAEALVGEPGVHVVEHVREIMELVALDLDTESFSLV